jgi:hypothetical protein
MVGPVPAYKARPSRLYPLSVRLAVLVHRHECAAGLVLHHPPRGRDGPTSPAADAPTRPEVALTPPGIPRTSRASVTLPEELDCLSAEIEGGRVVTLMGR